MKNIQTLFVFVLLVLGPVVVQGQQVFSTALGYGSGTGVQLFWTIGEPVIETYAGTSSILTQGFHQSRLTVTAIEQTTFPGLTLSVYPNPVSTILKLEISRDKVENIYYHLFGLDGKLLLQKKVENQPEQINLEPYPSGVYLLKVLSSENKPLQTFKIVKN